MGGLHKINRPKFFLLVGLSGSGKSHRAKEYAEEHSAKIYSGDAVIDDAAHKQIRADLDQGISVVCDAQNLRSYQRQRLLWALTPYNFERICALTTTPFERCLDACTYSSTPITYEALNKQRASIEIPWYEEGWESILLTRSFPMHSANNQLFWTPEEAHAQYRQLLTRLEDIPHDVPSCQLTIGEHLRRSTSLMQQHLESGLYRELPHRIQQSLVLAAGLHDIGKPAVKRFVDRYSIPSTLAYYLGHEHVSAYESFSFTVPLALGGTDADPVLTAHLIDTHTTASTLCKSAELLDHIRRKQGLLADCMALLNTVNQQAKLPIKETTL